jgi:putative DNA primase/helicase
MENNPKYSLTGLNVPAEQFLNTLVDVEEDVNIRIFEDQGDGAFTGQNITIPLKKFSDTLKSLTKHNAANRGIFVVVNSGGRKDSDITRINAHFVEIDNGTHEEQLERIWQFPLPPSLIVRTRKSLHCYWLMKSAPPKESEKMVLNFRYVQRQLVAQFDGDKACINLSRVLRIPSFYHCKAEPYLVECVKFNPELRYTQAELSAALPEVEPEVLADSDPAPNSKKFKDIGKQRGIMLVGMCEFIKFCKRNAVNLPEPLWYAMITILSVFKGGEDKIHTLSKPYPKYDVHKTNAKIKHFLTSGTKPMTCRKLAELGFECPKRQSCQCNSPAGWAFRPLETKELKKRLTSTKKADDILANIKIANTFIEDFLFNQEPYFAEVFIKDTLKSHFGFKSGDMSGLVANYREMHKEHARSNEAQREKSELPEWYEFTQSGGIRFKAGILANYLRDKFHAFYCTEQYYYYHNGVYVPRADKDAKATVRSYLDPHDVTMNHINDAEGQWQLIIRKAIKEINPNPYVINVKNGLYYILEDRLEPHRTDFFSTVQMQPEYHPDAKCPQFMAFLRSVLDEPEIGLLQEIYGYLLVPVTKAQKSFILCGEPNVGKSTILTVLQDHIIGEDNVCNIAMHKLNERFQPAELFGKIANIYADLPDKPIDDVGMFKAVTGEDRITGERKYRDAFSFKPFARFLFSCNELFRNYGDRSWAFYRRLIIIKFCRPVPEEKKDVMLIDKLADEKDGILLWAIQGLKRLHANKYQFTETDKTRAELRQYMIQNSSALAFADDMCVIEKDAMCMRDDLFKTYEEFCSNTNLKSMGYKRFLKDIGGISGVELSHHPVNRRAIFTGIKLS